MDAIKSLASSLEIGQPQIEGALAVFPLFRRDSAPMDYVLLDEALDQELARVSEVTEAGHVPELSFENTSDKRILLVDGDELVGARQNRIINISIMVGPGKKLVIPVSCVEQGRWSYRSARFAAAKRSLFASAKAKKMAAVSRSLRERGARRSDQGEIWEDISCMMSKRSVASDTSAMADIYESADVDLARYEKALSAHSKQAGAAFACGSRIIGLEVFDAPEAFAKCFSKMVKSYAMDVEGEAKAADPAKGHDNVRQFIESITKAIPKSYSSLGEGEDARLENDNLAGGALIVGERLVHLAAYRISAG